MPKTPEPFVPTHTFTHKYAKAHVLRKYLLETAELTEEQFRIETQDNEVKLQLKGDSVNLSEEQIKEIYKLFQVEEDKLKKKNAEEEQDGQE